LLNKHCVGVGAQQSKVCYTWINIFFQLILIDFFSSLIFFSIVFSFLSEWFAVDDL